MAAKTKAKKPAAKKTAAKKRPPRKRKAAAPKPQAPALVVPNHRFEAGSEVRIFPRSMVGVEKSMGREPIPSPTATAKVADDGTLQVSGLGPGTWTAAGIVAGRWLYFDFAVKSDG